MSKLDNRIILEPDDYKIVGGFIFINGASRLKTFDIAPPKAPEGTRLVYYYECLLCGEELPPEDVMNHNHHNCIDEEMEQEARESGR